MDSMIDTLILDIEELLLDLKVYWLENKSYTYNPNAFEKIKDSGNNIMCCCPYHVESKPSFGILKDNPYTWNCFSCGASGNIAQLVTHVCELSTEVHGERFIIKHYADIDKEQRPPIDIVGILDNKDLDRKISHSEDELDKFANKRHNYLYSRGFTERTLKKYEVGFDERARAIVIPIRTSKGLIRFFKKRSVDSKMFLNETNIFKKDIVFGLYYLLQAMDTVNEIYLNESETDTMSCYQAKLPAGAILGRVLFDEQVKELLKAGVKTVNLFYDNDINGLRCAYYSYLKLRKYPIRVNLVEYPGVRFALDTWDESEVTYKDANDLLKSKRMNEIKLIQFEMTKYDWTKITKKE